jgi:hypothetical protein
MDLDIEMDDAVDTTLHVPIADPEHNDILVSLHGDYI